MMLLDKDIVELDTYPYTPHNLIDSEIHREEDTWRGRMSLILIDV
jgi:hypothetical protein